MVLFKLNSLNKEIDRVYNEHYKDCKHQEVHDFYRAKQFTLIPTLSATSPLAKGGHR